MLVEKGHPRRAAESAVRAAGIYGNVDMDPIKQSLKDALDLVVEGGGESIGEIPKISNVSEKEEEEKGEEREGEEEEPGREEESEEDEGEDTTTPTAAYQRVTIETPVDWQEWYDFYQAVIIPLVESGAEVHLQLRLEATGEIDANLVDLSVKESVMQFDSRGKAEVEE